jgi:hypothetical protein
MEGQVVGPVAVEAAGAHRAALALEPINPLGAVGWHLAKPGNENWTQHWNASEPFGNSNIALVIFDSQEVY